MIAYENLRNDVKIKNLDQRVSTISQPDPIPDTRRNVSFLDTGLPVREEESYQDPKKTSTTLVTNRLLPILDYKYNIREITKQCILLEDHLINKEKSCYDCIIKHFLAMEALAEEALTLHKNLKQESTLNLLPTRIRELQKLWYSNPTKNSITVAQKLRQLRKEYMEDSFSIIFQENAASCNSNSCKTKL